MSTGGLVRPKRSWQATNECGPSVDNPLGAQFPIPLSSQRAIQGTKNKKPGFRANIKEPFRFLDLPVEIRILIYDILLGPHSGNQLTPINYTLRWPHLISASDIKVKCNCPRPDKAQMHTYTRHICPGPEVKLSKRKELHTSGPPQGPSMAIRKTTQTEISSHRPGTSILRTCRLVYTEALPYLYSGRTFHVLDGTAESGGLGRYQCYATVAWLNMLSEEARSRVEGLKVLVAPYEQDCELKDGRRSCADFCHFATTNLDRLRRVEVELYNIGRPYLSTPLLPRSIRAVSAFEVVKPFCILLRRLDLQSSVIVTPWDFPAGLPHINRDPANLARVRSEMLGQHHVDQLTCETRQKLALRSAKHIQRSQQEDEVTEGNLSNSISIRTVDAYEDIGTDGIVH